MGRPNVSGLDARMGEELLNWGFARVSAVTVTQIGIGVPVVPYAP